MLLMFCKASEKDRNLETASANMKILCPHKVSATLDKAVNWLDLRTTLDNDERFHMPFYGVGVWPDGCGTHSPINIDFYFSEENDLILFKMLVS